MLHFTGDQIEIVTNITIYTLSFVSEPAVEVKVVLLCDFVVENLRFTDLSMKSTY